MKPLFCPCSYCREKKFPLPDGSILTLDPPEGTPSVTWQQLPDGSILTLDLETNIFDLPKRERELVFGIVDLVQDYEKERI